MTALGPIAAPTARPMRGSAQPRPSNQPLVMELAGLAGTGKSTFARALARLDSGIRARPHVSLPRYLASVPPLIPTLLGLHWPFRGILDKEMKRIVRVRALHQLARRATGCRTLLFDEGPVYMLARILVYGGERLQTRGFARWWRRAITSWAATLDLIVWLDAPNHVLAERLRTRSQWHPVQDASPEAIVRFLDSYRAAYARVVSELTAARPLAVWTVVTDHRSPALDASELLARLRGPQGIALRPWTLP